MVPRGRNSYHCTNLASCRYKTPEQAAGLPLATKVGRVCRERGYDWSSEDWNLTACHWWYIARDTRNLHVKCPRHVTSLHDDRASLERIQTLSLTRCCRQDPLLKLNFCRIVGRNAGWSRVGELLVTFGFSATAQISQLADLKCTLDLIMFSSSGAYE